MENLQLRGNQFRSCEPCSGMGFLKTGVFADRKFVTCEACKGIGQAYLDPIPDVIWRSAPVPASNAAVVTATRAAPANVPVILSPSVAFLPLGHLMF